MAVRIGSVQAVISCLAVGACVQGIPPVDNEGDTDTTGAPMEPPNPDVVFDGLGPGLVLNPDHVAPGAVVIVGAPGRSVESAAGAGRVFLMESVTGGGLGTAVSVAPTLAEGNSVAAPDCSRSLEIDSGPNRKFGSSFALYSRAVVPDVNVLEYTQNLLVGAPTAGAMSGRVIGTAGCASCGLLPRPPGELLETEVGTRFGTSLSVGFFEGDVAGGVEFLAVGAPSFNFVGGVHIYSQQGFRTWETETGFPIGDGLLACDFGGNVGPNPDSETFRERTLSGGFANEGFGSALVTGDLNCDGIDDLAVGAPTADVPSSVGIVPGAGAVYVYYGGPLGLGNEGSLVLTEGQLGLGGTPETNDHFGSALAVGDFDGSRTLEPNGGDTCFDLAIGAPDEDGGRGQVYVVYGGPGGPQPFNSDVLELGSVGVPGPPIQAIDSVPHSLPRTSADLRRRPSMISSSQLPGTRPAVASRSSQGRLRPASWPSSARSTPRRI